MNCAYLTIKKTSYEVLFTHIRYSYFFLASYTFLCIDCAFSTYIPFFFTLCTEYTAKKAAPVYIENQQLRAVKQLQFNAQPLLHSQRKIRYTFTFIENCRYRRNGRILGSMHSPLLKPQRNRRSHLMSVLLIGRCRTWMDWKLPAISAISQELRWIQP